MTTLSESVEQDYQKRIDYWNCEALIAQEHGDEEQAKLYFEKATAIRRALEDLRSDNTDHR